MGAYLNIAKIVAQQLAEISFFKYCLPIITGLGVLTLVYFGCKGIIREETLFLFPLGTLGSVATPAQTAQFFTAITGKGAIIAGVCYLFIATILLIILGPINYFLWI